MANYFRPGGFDMFAQLSRKNRSFSISFFQSSHCMVLFVCILFLASVFIRFQLSDFPKVFRVFQDELRYLSIAESLGEGRGIAIYNHATDFQKILYSITLIPAFFFSEKAVQIKAICFINAAIMSSGIFPVYLLAKKLLAKRSHIVLTLAVFLVSSEFSYTLVFMSEVLYMPLGLWAVYLFYQIITLPENSARNTVAFYGVVFGIVVYLLYLNKEIALSFLIAHFLYALYNTAIWKIWHQKNSLQVRNCFLTFMAALASFCILFLALKLTLFRGFGNSYNQTSLSAIASLHNILYMFYGFFYYLMCVLIAWFFFPVVFPLTVIRKISQEKRDFLVFIVLLLFISAGVIAYTITVREDLDKIVPRIHLRYICFLFMPFFILFLSALKETAKRHAFLPQLILSLLFILIVLCFFQGAADASQVDNSSLKYIPFYLINDSRLRAFKILLALAVLGATMFMHIKYRAAQTIFYTAFFTVIIAVNLLNYQIAYSTYTRLDYYGITAKEEAELNALRNFVKSHPEDSFLVIHPNFRNRYQAMLDTYLNCANVYTTDIIWITEHQGDAGYSLSGEPVRPVYENGYYPAPLSIEYVIAVSSDLYWDEPYPEIVLSEDIPDYTIYQVGSPDTLARCSGLIPNVPGDSYTITQCPYFFSMYPNDGHTFISDDSDNYLLYGPYAYITAGTYSITFRVSYNGDLPAGTSIGFAEISAPGLDLSSYKTPIISGENEVVISNIVIPENLSSFESKLYATEPGIQFINATYTKSSY